jgi:hypothetical protein
MTARETTVGELLSELRAVLARHGRLLLVIGIVLGVADTLLAYLFSRHDVNSSSGIAGLVVGYFLLKELLSREGLILSAGGFWSYFGASILTGLAIVVGLICLVVPGLILAARWCVAPALALARGQGAVDSMRASWAVTKENAGQIILFGIVVFGLYLIAALIVGFAVGAIGLSGSPVDTAVTEFSGAIGNMLGAAAIIAIYRPLVGGTQEFEELFA